MKRHWTLLAVLVVVTLGAVTLVNASALAGHASGKQFSASGTNVKDKVAILATPWIDAKESEEIAYFLHQSPNRLRRYSLKEELWLDDIVLSDTPTAFAVDLDGIYISFGRRTVRFTLDGTAESHLTNTATDASQLFCRGAFLYIYHGSTMLSVDKSNGTIVDTQDYWYQMKGLDVAPAIGKAFGRSVGISPSDIVEVELNNDGTLGNQQDSPYHGDYPSADKVYVFPGEARVADNSGIIYNANDLTYSNSLAGRFDDLDFYGDLPIVLRDNILIAYSNVFVETGRVEVGYQPLKIFVNGDQVFSFYESQGAIQVGITPVDTLTPEEPGQPVNPNGLDYVPDYVSITADEELLFLSRSYLSVFRWSASARSYTDTLPLTESPLFMAYSGDSDHLYLAYPSGRITQTDLNQGSAKTEEPLVNSPQTPCGLSTAGSYLFVCDPSGAWVSHFTYSYTGTLISQVEWNYFSHEYVWNDANEKMYFFRDDTSPNDLLWEEIDENGVIGANMDSPYHSSEGIIHPVRVAPDGSVVVLGSGRIYDALTLEHINALSNDIDDAAWLNDTLYTMRESQGSTQIQKWGTNYAVDVATTVTGTPIRMFPIEEGLLVTTLAFERPYFTILDESLRILYETLENHTFLPAIARNYCSDYSDDFSNPASGWPIGGHEYYDYGYLDGEYRIHSKRAGYFYIFSAPSCVRENYVVEVDARWTGATGAWQGLVFGIVGDFQQYYLFAINTDYGLFTLLHRDNSAGAWNSIVSPTNTNGINGGNATNHLKVIRQGSEITLIVNNTTLGVFYDSRATGLTGAGIVSMPYDDRPVSDARFDNFSIARLPGTSSLSFRPDEIGQTGAPGQSNSEFVAHPETIKRE